MHYRTPDYPSPRYPGHTPHSLDHHIGTVAGTAGAVPAAAAAADGAAPGSFRDAAASAHAYLVSISEVTKKPSFIQMPP